MFSKYAKNYLDHVKVYCSFGTFSFTQNHLTTLYSDFGTIKIKKINKKFLLDFVVIWKARNLTANTINKRIAIIKRIFKFNNIKSDIFEIKKFKEKFTTFGVLNADERLKLKSILNDLSLRDNLMIRLFYDTGIRLNEMLHLKVDEIDLLFRVIHLTTTKTNSPRKVFFSAETKKILDEYLKEKKKNIFLFEKSPGVPMTTNSIELLFRRIRKKYDMKILSPHVLRHTLSTTLYINKADLLFISTLLGHSSPNTTKRYIHYDEILLRTKYDELNPGL